MDFWKPILEGMEYLDFQGEKKRISTATFGLAEATYMIRVPLTQWEYMVSRYGRTEQHLRDRLLQMLYRGSGGTLVTTGVRVDKTYKPDKDARVYIIILKATPAWEKLADSIPGGVVKTHLTAMKLLKQMRKPIEDITTSMAKMGGESEYESVSEEDEDTSFDVPAEGTNKRNRKETEKSSAKVFITK